MATILARRANAPMQARAGVVLCALLALLLPAIWAGVGIYVLRARVVQQMGAAAAGARMHFDDLVARAQKITALFTAADARSTNRIALAARMLGLEARLAPAENLFLYDASGRFVAATVPLQPGEDLVGRSAWFRAAAAGFHSSGLTLFGPARQPLGEGQGFILTRPLIGRSGKFAGVVGTFLSLPSIRALMESAELPPGSRVELRAAAGEEVVLGFSVPGARPPDAFESALDWIGGVPAVVATVSVPGGLKWQATAGAFSETAAAESQSLGWGAGLLAAGPLLLIFALGFRRRQGQRPQGQRPQGQRPQEQGPQEPQSQSEPRELAPVARGPEAEWMWEVDAEGFLVGVGGNAPRSLVEAVGTSLFDLVAGDPRSRDLRDAIARRVALRGLTIEVLLPGDATGKPHRFSLTGFPVEFTGGFWGTAGEIRAVTAGGGESAGLERTDAAAPVQASALTANSQSMPPSSVRPRRYASALSCATLM